MKRNMISCAGAQINIKASWWKCAEFAPFITQIIIIIVTQLEDEEKWKWAKHNPECMTA